ncbi:hypothetical protein EC988_004660, partial [Linderina pennispora]
MDSQDFYVGDAGNTQSYYEYSDFGGDSQSQLLDPLSQNAGAISTDVGDTESIEELQFSQLSLGDAHSQVYSSESESDQEEESGKQPDHA